MITADVTLDSNGILYEVKTSGHSGYSHKGSDIVCAGVSAFTQSGYILLKRLLGENVTLTQDTHSDNENVLAYRIEHYPDEMRQMLQGVTLYLITGLNEIQRQYNENIRVNIK